MNALRSGFLLYGSTGFTGDLMARLAVQRGLRPILAGRNPGKVEAQARELGLDCRVFDLNDDAALERAVGEVGAVLNCAGPFLYTYKPVVEACLATGSHYLDITGEVQVFEGIYARDAEARARGVTLMPGVGFDIVPTDCLAVHLKQRLPSATHLTLAFTTAQPSRGSARTLTYVIFPYGCKVRRNGRLETLAPGSKTRMIDFGQGPCKTLLAPWDDGLTAYYSTGIPNIEDYMPASPEIERFVAAMRILGPLLNLPLLRQWVKRNIEKTPVGPSDEDRARVRTFAWGEVTDDQGQKAVSLLEGPEAYNWTLITALDAAQKVLEGAVPAGFQTPGQAFGADFVLQSPQVTRRDIE